MKHFIPTNRIASAGANLENSGQVKPKKVVGWELQRKVPADVAMNIARERRERAARGLHT